ncbi:hypothetical protein SAMN05216376_101580 [Mameliella alba]|uniref:hypothetical protein n=2 Tax=Mameliella alba TaxID=561184 RepID=UPI00088C5866|nr:hypothetical protein [Mameliella alba]PTR42655.1 hypothetical protein LX94_00578 [Mameliella alba]GGF72725.1 hypothetical protein GCM10011319_36580 [Mameliella alba]SDC19425.1 hypothetical protein SAMN05216376_101580 [Mameliella alba]
MPFLPERPFTELGMTMPYRPTAFRKQDQSDFSRRVRRIDPEAQAQGAATRRRAQPKMLTAGLTGFGAAYAISAIATNRDRIELALRQEGLAPDTQHLVLSALTAALAATLVMLTFQVMRAALTAGVARKNGRAYFLGAIVAFGLFYTPDFVWQLGFDLLDGRSQNVLASAGAFFEDSFPGLNIDQISFTSSGGR